MATDLSVCVVGAGPSGFYAVKSLLADQRIGRVDLLERLPVPYGLVRHGVAPDHENIKRVARTFDKIADSPRFRFFGNVRVGHDVSVAALSRCYAAVVWAVGCEHGQKLGIPGENLKGVVSATDFVFWYNGHPDHRHHAFDLSKVRRVVVVGNGNVAVDVARVLARPADTLASTDIADHALAVLKESAVESVTLLGRRGPAQAAYSARELKELSSVTQVRVDPRDLVVDSATLAWLPTAGREARDNLAVVQDVPENPGRRPVHVRFLTSPAALAGTTSLERVQLVRNVLVPKGANLAAQPAGEPWWEDVDLLIPAIGYKGVPIPGLPYHEGWGTIPNRDGRVVDAAGERVPGHYVVGWAKRGPTGVIGTNAPDAAATVQMLLADLPRLVAGTDRIDDVLAGRRVVDYAAWRHLDALERARGAGVRPRVKYTDPEQMLALMELREPVVP